MASPVKGLEDLLLDMLDPGELRRVLRGLGEAGVRLVDALNEGVSRTEYVHEAARKLQARGLADRAFFDALIREAPGRKAEIEAVAAAGGVAEARPAPNSAPFRAAIRKRVEEMPWLSRQLGLSKTLSEVCVRVEVCEQGAGQVSGVRGEHAHQRLMDVLGPSEARWVMLGEPGGGKSTLLRRLARDLADGTDWLPVLLHAGDLREHTLAEAVRRVWGAQAAAVVAVWPPERLVVLVDGLDETGHPKGTGIALQAQAADLGAATLIVAGRPEGYPEPWAGFGALQILPLAEGEQAKLLVGLGVSEALAITSLQRLRADRRLAELAGRPLILTLAALVLLKDGVLPERRAKLYERALDCLLHRAELNTLAPHDVVRAPTDVEAALVWLAPRLLGRGEGPWSRAAILSYLRGNPTLMKALAETWKENTADAFLDEIGHTVGVLVPQGRAFGFAHRTLGEYLASRGLAKDTGAREVAVQNGLKDPALWAEVLALTVGQLPPKESDALVQRIADAGEPGRPLLHRVIGDAEGLSANTVQTVLGLARGWDKHKDRQKVLQGLPNLVGDRTVAVRLLDRLRRETTDGNDLYWIRETLWEIAADQQQDAEPRREANFASLRIFEHLMGLDTVQTMIRPLWKAIPAGSFDMGNRNYTDERPVHTVEIASPFSMMSVPVTWAMYRHFDPGHDAARHNFGGPLAPDQQGQVPVYRVTWYAATMFAAWVGARLPLEPEWEYACRAGTRTPYWSGASEQDLTRVGWSLENSRGRPHAVAEKPANAWGLHDLHGNVWEWCQDVYAVDAYPKRAPGMTVDPANATYAIGKNEPQSADSATPAALRRVLRGGGWLSPSYDARSAFRYRFDPSGAGNAVGFRLVRPIPPRA